MYPRGTLLRAGLTRELVPTCARASKDPRRVTTALSSYQRGKGDLADYLLGLRGEEAGVRTTFTFDRALRGDERFTLRT